MNPNYSQHQDCALPFPAEGVILAGGASRRMGRDKAWLRIEGHTLIGKLISTMEPLFHSMRIITNTPEQFFHLSPSIQTDLRPGSGPLGGIHTSLADTSRDVVFVTPCDFPFLNRAFICLMAGLLEEHDAVVPWNKGYPVPVCAFYSVRCLPAVEASLNQGELRPMAFLDKIDVRWVNDDEWKHLDPNGLCLTNLNTPEDYRKALEIAGR